MKVLVAAFIASAAATKQSVSMMSADDRAQLRDELAEWRKEFGSIAEAEGLLPPTPESLNPIEAEAEALQRFHDNNVAIEEARRNNPEATFNNKHPYALMTDDEFKKFLGQSYEEGHSSFRALPAAEMELTAALEASVDWTTGKCVNPVRSQGQCGSCWAFSAVGTTESAHCLVTGELLDLSEQHVASCSTNGGSQGCNGGAKAAAIDYLSKNGVCLDKDYPYTSGSSGQTGSCKTSCSKKKLSIGATVRTSGEENLAAALNTQPVSVSVEAGNSVWKNYRGGVVSQCPGARSDHAVIAVGYDGESYKIRNSWGPNWGESGHIRLRRGVGGAGTCNVVKDVSFPKINGSPKPTSSPSNGPTNKPKTTAKPSNGPTTKPKPTAKPLSRPGCSTCSRCSYPAEGSCLSSEYTKDDCEYYSAEYGTVWCGN